MGVQDSDYISVQILVKKNVSLRGGILYLQQAECGELPETNLAFCADVRRGAFLAVVAAFPAHGGVCGRTVT